MKKILISGMSFNTGGVETYIMSMFRALDKQSFHCDFINDQKRDDIAFQDEIVSSGSRIIHLHGKSQWKKFMKEHTGEYDAIIFNIIAPFFHQIRVCCRYGGFRAVIVHSHNGSVDVPAFMKPFIPFAMKYERAKLSALPITRWACSEKAAEWMFGKDKDYVFVKNGINTKKFRYDDSVRTAIRRELNLKAGDFCIGHIGRFDPQKNHEYLIRIFHEFSKSDKDAKLLLAGPMLNVHITEKVKAYIKDNDLEDRVLLLGERKDSDRLYQAMDVFVLPSLYEGLPIVGIEAQTAGLPCLFSDTISDQVSVLDTNRFLPITDSSIADWCRALHDAKHMSLNRNKSYLEIEEAGFIMEKEIRHIEKELGKIC